MMVEAARSLGVPRVVRLAVVHPLAHRRAAVAVAVAVAVVLKANVRDCYPAPKITGTVSDVKSGDMAGTVAAPIPSNGSYKY